jgi:cold shock CspA family protein
MRGVITGYIRHRGFGFLTSDEDVHLLVFFHVSAWTHTQAPAIGAEVSYDCIDGDKGLQARNVRLINQPQPQLPQLSTAAAVLAEKAQAATTEVD